MFQRGEYLIRFSNPGYEDLIVPISSRISGWFFANILLGGVFGMIIDGSTGAMWKLETDIIGSLSRSSTTSLDLEIHFFDINDIPDEWKNHLVKIN